MTWILYVIGFVVALYALKHWAMSDDEEKDDEAYDDEILYFGEDDEDE
jgi:hypothetical protein